MIKTIPITRTKLVIINVVILCLYAQSGLSQVNNSRILWKTNITPSFGLFPTAIDACENHLLVTAPDPDNIIYYDESFGPNYVQANESLDNAIAELPQDLMFDNPRVEISITETNPLIRQCYGENIRTRELVESGVAFPPELAELFDPETLLGPIIGRTCSDLLNDPQPGFQGATNIQRVRSLCNSPIDNFTEFDFGLDTSTKDEGEGCGVGNPCNPATGNKFQTETDFIYGDLRFMRFYNSRNLVDIGLGRGWRMSFQSKLTIMGDNIVVISASGKGQPWTRVGDQWQGDEDTELLLEQEGDEYLLTYPNNSTERFGSDGQLLLQTDSNGQSTVYTYNSNSQLTSVVNQYGRRIELSYTDGLLSRVTDPRGGRYDYRYNDLQNLISMTLPDLTPETNNDNPRRIYHYEDQNFPSHLTGITDENGDRYATWSYDSDGRAISSEHAQTTNAMGQEKVELEFHEEN